jgi:hypothetical protein
MKQFTRTTIVKSQIRIRRERMLPKSGEVVVRVGQEVTPVQVVARTPLETDFHIIPASDELGVSLEALADYLLVEKGDALEAGSIVAEKKRVLGQKQIIKPVEGILFDIINGRVIVQQTSDWLELRASVAGRIVNYIANRGVVIETSGSLIQAAWGSGKEGYGKIKLLARSPNSLLRPDQIDRDYGEYMLVAGEIDQSEVLQKIEESQARGVIVGSMPTELCQLGTRLSIPIILTDGVGTQGMSSPVFDLLKQADDHDVSLFADYDPQASRRPEIIIPEPATPGTEAPPESKPVTVGQTVRILRPPYTSQVGEVVRLYELKQVTPIGTKAYGADVQLSDGNVVFVPSANLDVMI